MIAQNVITNTGSPALANQLMQLEQEKETLDIRIKEEERSLEANELSEAEIKTAFRQAQQMFRSRELPQMEQLINLYLDRVNVYPEYVEVCLNQVPTSVMKSTSHKKEPAASGLHTFRIELSHKNISGKRRKLKNETFPLVFQVILSRETSGQNLLHKNGQKETRAQDILGASKSGGAEGS